jgi:EAL domain-containing protein (putative c-di-GMP-specific phosphodiesterase class I)
MLERPVFYVTTPSAHAKSIISTEFERCELTATEPYQGVLAVNFHPGKFERLSATLTAELAPDELQRSRCRIVNGGTIPSPSDLMQTQSLDNFLTWVRCQWLTHLIRDRRLTTFFQPIVDCQSPRRVFAYECLLRGKQADGEMLPPDLLFAAARATDQVALLDAAAKRVHIAAAGRPQLDCKMFINFNPSGDLNSDDGLRETMSAVKETGHSTDRFVFEVVESDRTSDAAALVRILDAYRRHGFQVALDDFGAGYNSLNLLTEIKPDFIKLDMRLIHDVDRDPYKARVAAKVLELAQELAVGTVVEGVETSGEWQWSADHGANYAQGFLFAKPAPIPPASRFRPELAAAAALA